MENEAWIRENKRHKKRAENNGVKNKRKGIKE